MLILLTSKTLTADPWRMPIGDWKQIEGSSVLRITAENVVYFSTNGAESMKKYQLNIQASVRGEYWVKVSSSAAQNASSPIVEDDSPLMTAEKILFIFDGRTMEILIFNTGSPIQKFKMEMTKLPSVPAAGSAHTMNVWTSCPTCL